MSHRKIQDEVLGSSILTALGVSNGYRSIVLRRLGELWRATNGRVGDFVRKAWKLLKRATDAAGLALGRVFKDAMTTSWFTGTAMTIDKFPAEVRTQVGGAAPPNTPTAVAVADWYGDDNTIRFPRLEQASRVIASTPLVGEEDFRAFSDRTDKDVRFTVQGLTQDATKKVRDILAKTPERGFNFREFVTDVSDAIDTGALGPGTLERVFRTNTQRALYEASENIIKTPLVSDLFPYVIRIPIRDDRLTDLCFELSVSGLNGTGVYRRTDPVWKKTQVPSHWNCRCMTQFLTIRQAARLGIGSAERWQKTDNDPRDFVSWPKLSPQAFKLWESWDSWEPQISV